MLTRAISTDGGVAVMAVDSTEIVKEMIEKHKGMSNLAVAALGRLLTGASLMGSNLKGEDFTLTIKIDGGGPLGQIVAVSDSSGNVKGFVYNETATLPKNKNGFENVGMGVGNSGTLTVIRDFNMKTPQVGQVDIFSGEIAEDITYYYAQSEQVPTVCGLGVLFNEDGTFKSSGGFLAQLLPGAYEENIDKLEKAIDLLPPVASMISSGATSQEICELVLLDQEPQILDQREVSYKCNCSEEHFEKVLMSIGKKELNEIINEDKETTLTCEYCNKEYHFTTKMLEEIRDKTNVK